MRHWWGNTCRCLPAHSAMQSTPTTARTGTMTKTRTMSLRKQQRRKTNDRKNRLLPWFERGTSAVRLQAGTNSATAGSRSFPALHSHTLELKLREICSGRLADTTPCRRPPQFTLESLFLPPQFLLFLHFRSRIPRLSIGDLLFFAIGASGAVLHRGALFCSHTS